MSAPRAVVMFSSGAGSWAAARRWIDAHGTDGVTLLFADVKGGSESEHAGEDADNYRFLHQAADDLGAPLVTLNEGRDVWQVFHDERMIGNTRLSVCSRALKQRPVHAWLAENEPDAAVIVGIDWTEEHRLPAMRRAYAPRTVLAPLCWPPYRDRDEILRDLRSRDIEPPRLYALGFEHANCGGFCVRAGQGAFVRLLRTMPDRYAYHERREQEMRDYLGKDVAILRDRTGGTTTPLTLRALRERVEAGAEQLDLLDIGGCGCFVAEEAS